MVSVVQVKKTLVIENTVRLEQTEILIYDYIRVGIFFTPDIDEARLASLLDPLCLSLLLASNNPAYGTS